MHVFSKRYEISWSALFSGAIIGVGLNFLLNLFALAIGLASFSVSSSGKTEFSFIGFLGFVISAVIAMFFSGWISGKLTPPSTQNRAWGLLIGFLSWSLQLIITIILLTNMIQYAAFHSNFTSNLVAVKIVNNAPILTQTKAHDLANSPLSFNIETQKKEIRLNAMATYLLFLIGSLSSIYGGYLGYRSSLKTRPSHHDKRS